MVNIIFFITHYISVPVIYRKMKHRLLSVRVEILVDYLLGHIVYHDYAFLLARSNASHIELGTSMQVGEGSNPHKPN